MSPSYLNLCCGCGEDFGSVSLFDRHRVGLHEYTYSEGLRLDPPREDGRRCLDADEMTARGWERNQRGRWIDPATVESIRRYREAQEAQSDAVEPLEGQEAA